MRAQFAVVLIVALAACSDRTGPAGPVGPLVLSLASEVEAVRSAAESVVDTVTVMVRDGAGAPAPGIPLSWSALFERDSLDADAITVADGTARAVWYFRPLPGAHSMGVSALDEAAVTASTELRAFRATSVAAGFNWACGLVGQRAWCWGVNRWPFPAGGPDGEPLEMAGNHNFVAIDVEEELACALDTSGAPRCWGYPRTTTRVPELFSGFPPLTSIAVSESSLCGLTAAGEAWCGGSNYPAGPAPIANAPALRVVRAGGYLSLSACGIAIADASAWCWGSGKALGNGTTEETYSTAVAVAPPAGVSTLSFQAIAVASETVCGLTMEGLWCWGDATNLPDPSIGFIALPQHFPLAGPLLAGGDGGFVLASGSSVRGFGTVYHWVGGPGELTMPNDFGGAQRGETATPVPVSAIAAGQTFCLTRADEQVMCSYGVMGKARWTGAFLAALPMLPVPDPELLE